MEVRIFTTDLTGLGVTSLLIYAISEAAAEGLECVLPFEC